MRKIAVVLAAGKGTRMKSEKAKVVHPVCGRPIITWVVEAIRKAGFDDIYVVCGHRAEEVQAVVGESVNYIFQEKQLGTGHAVQTAMSAITEEDIDTVLVTCGDTPLISGETLEAFLEAHGSSDHVVDVMTTIQDNPTGYGRIIREFDEVIAIVEEKDASEEEKKIREINVGTYLFDMTFLRNSLTSLTCDNAQGEFYLTDLVAAAHRKNSAVGGFILADKHESLGVNNRVQLSEAERYMQARINSNWMLAGVTMQDPTSVYIAPTVTLEADVVLEPNVMLLGNTSIGKGTVIGMNCKLTDTVIGQNCEIQQTVTDRVVVGENVRIGPFAYLRPGTVLKDNIKIGDFVEVKNSIVENGSKIPHLSYVGDSDVGECVNIGCGTITCNYDGKNKFRTTIKDGAFIGSNTNLVAPVTVGKDAYVGAGTTVRKNVEENTLAVSKAPLIVRERNDK